MFLAAIENTMVEIIKFHMDGSENMAICDPHAHAIPCPP